MFLRFVHGVKGPKNVNEGKSPLITIDITDQPEVISSSTDSSVGLGTSRPEGQ
jgi:hypothetical protein